MQAVPAGITALSDDRALNRHGPDPRDGGSGVGDNCAKIRGGGVETWVRRNREGGVTSREHRFRGGITSREGQLPKGVEPRA